MRILLSIVLVLLSVSLQALRAQVPSETARLAELCKVWGEIKVFNPLVSERVGFWDTVLINAIPRVRAAASSDDLNWAYRELLESLGDPNTFVVQSGDPSAGGEVFLDPKRSDCNWITVESSAGLTDGKVRKVISKIDPYKPIVMDLRWPERTSVSDARIEQALRDAVEIVLPQGRVTMPSVRRVVYNGYLPQTEGGSQIYSKAYEYLPTEPLDCSGDTKSGVPIVFIVNSGSLGVSRLLQALQQANLARVIAVKESPREFGIRSASRRLSTGLQYQFRVSESVFPEGSAGFRPDTIVTDLDSHLSFQRLVPSHLVRERPKVVPDYKEIAYETVSDLSPELRLLTLFKLWTVGKYFYAYHDLLDMPWDSVLPMMIPAYIAADDLNAFNQAFLSTTSRFQDGHVSVSHPSFTKLMGSRMIPFTGRVLGGRLIVTEIDSVLLTKGEVAVGDEVVKIEGASLDSMRREFSSVISFSTSQELDVKLLRRVFRTNHESKSYQIRSTSGEERDVTVASHPQLTISEPIPKPAHSVLDVEAKIHYVNMMSLKTNEVKSAFEKFRDGSAVIFDLRGYPEPTIWQLAALMARRPIKVCKFGSLRLSDPDSVQWSWQSSDYELQPAKNAGYGGKIVVLIDENAISRSEHTALFLKALGAKFIGSRSRGTNGDVTNTILPGGYWVSFTGLNVKHADGSELQRQGIIPDFFVEPTPEDIRSNRDAVLGKALDYLRN